MIRWKAIQSFTSIRKNFDIEKNADSIYRKVKIQNCISSDFSSFKMYKKKNMKVMPNDGEVKGILFV